MKAVVVDIAGKYAVVLDKKGSFVKVRNTGNVGIGCEVDLPSAKVLNLNTMVKIASVAAIFVLVLGLSYGTYCYNKPYSYINVDINPSIELTANVFNRIIRVEALNRDGENLLSKGRYKNRKLQDGVEQILGEAADKGYLRNEYQNAVMFTVSGNDDKKLEQIESTIEAAASSELKSVKLEANVLVEKVSVKKHDEARKSGISPGKLVLIEKLQSEIPDTRIEDYKDTPVRDIIKLINDNKKQDTGKAVSASQKPTEQANEGNTVNEDSSSGQSQAQTASKGNKGHDNNKDGNKFTSGSSGNGNGKANGKGNGNGNGHKKANADIGKDDNNANSQEGYTQGNRNSNGKTNGKSNGNSKGNGNRNGKKIQEGDNGKKGNLDKNTGNTSINTDYQDAQGGNKALSSGAGKDSKDNNGNKNNNGQDNQDKGSEIGHGNSNYTGADGSGKNSDKAKGNAEGKEKDKGNSVNKKK